MIVNALAPDTAEGRAAERSNVFIIAALSCASGSQPVRIRNLSPGGALVEGSVLPLPGSPVRLNRGSLQASGEVVWSADGRAGLRFTCSISVADWLPRSTGGQQRVDEIVFKTKQGGPILHEPAPLPVSTAADVALALARLANGLVQLGERLADDPHVVAHFPADLQIIETTAARLEALSSADMTQ